MHPLPLALTTPELVYVVCVLGTGAYALARTLVLLGVVRKVRLVQIKKRNRFDSVPSGTPLEDPDSVALERGIESIERHSSVLRKMLAPVIVLLTLLFAAPAFLSDLSGAAASVTGAVLAVVLGLALRPFLENAVAGLVVSASRLVRIGDTLKIDGWYGTVEDITATHTTVKLWDWRRYCVPNSRMLQSTFLNYSLFDRFLWAYVEFWVAPDADLDEVREAAVRSPLESPHFSGLEEPQFWVTALDKDAVQCWAAAWAETPSAGWLLQSDMRTALAIELRRRGIPLSLGRVRWSEEAGAPPSDGPPAEGPLPDGEPEAAPAPGPR